MTEQLISLETAKLAKEKGFDEDTDRRWVEYLSDEVLFDDRSGKNIIFTKAGTKRIEHSRESVDASILTNRAPSQSLLQKWIRERHDIKVFVNYRAIGSDDYEYCYDIMHEPNKGKRQRERTVTIESLDHWGTGYNNVHPSNTYEVVLESGLLEALSLIPTK